MKNIRPVVGVGIYILNQKKELLLMHRISNNGLDTWSPAGGHLEFGESFAECVSREAREEWGITVSKIRLLALTNDKYQEDKQSITFHFKSQIKNGVPKIMEPHNFDEIDWFPLDNLPTPLFSPMKHFLDKNGIDLLLNKKPVSFQDLK